MLIINQRLTKVVVPLILLLSAYQKGQSQKIAPSFSGQETPRYSRLERKALGYEENIKKIKIRALAMLEENEVNYAKLDKLKRKVEKLSTKAKKCRYKEKSKRHVKVQERKVKKRMKTSLKAHRKLKRNHR